MAKGQMRSSKEKRKPKQDKNKKAPVAPSRYSPAPGQTGAGSNPGAKKN
jgi:hypothetical protein